MQAPRRAFTDLPVWGCERGFTSTDAAFGAAACRNGAGDPRNDAIAVSYEATTFNSQPIGSPTSVPGNCTNEGISAGAGGAVIADNRFFIANDVDGTPALYCRGSNGVGFSNRAALVPGTASLIEVPRQETSASAALSSAPQPYCMAEAMTNGRYLITARGLSAGAGIDPNNGRLVDNAGSEVWLQSILSPAIPVRASGAGYE